MAYIQIPRDLNNVKEKFMFGLPKRQVIFFGIGAGLGALFFYPILQISGVQNAVIALVMCIMPFGFVGLYEKNGEHLEKYLSRMIRVKYLRQGVRPYKSENIYDILEKQAIIDREVKKYGYQQNAKDKLIAAVKAADKIKVGGKNKKFK